MSYEVIKADIHRDRRAIIEFWDSHNDKKLGPKFDWIYTSNPDGEASTFLLKHSELEGYVGMASVFPRKFAIKNETYTGGIQGDFYIQSKHRTFGPALMLIRAILNAITELDLDFLYAFPNRKAEPIFRRAGYEYLGSTKKYIRLFNTQRLLKEKTPIPDSLVKWFGPLANGLINGSYPDAWTFNFGRYRTRVSSTLDFDVEHLLNDYQAGWFTSLKSKTYLAWKYEQDPDDDNLFFYISDRTDKVVGCIVFCIEQPNLVQIREILHTQDQYTLHALIGLFFKRMRTENHEYAYAQIYENSGILRAYNNLDLTVSDQGRKIAYAVNGNRKTSERVSRLLHSPSFCLTKSDEDS